MSTHTIRILTDPAGELHRAHFEALDTVEGARHGSSSRFHDE